MLKTISAQKDLSSTEITFEHQLYAVDILSSQTLYTDTMGAWSRACLCLQALRARNAPLTKEPRCGEYCVGVKPCRLKAIATPTSNLQTYLTAAYLTAARYLLHMVVLTLLSAVGGTRTIQPACLCEVKLWFTFFN